jgi:hypothetical protein
VDSPPTGFPQLLHALEVMAGEYLIDNEETGERVNPAFFQPRVTLDRAKVTPPRDNYRRPRLYARSLAINSFRR